MRRRTRRSRAGHEQAELNITAFMNLMVILVPFLLITAVFSRITILDLYIPPASDTPPSQQQNDEKPLVINVLIRDDSIQVADNRKGLIRSIPKKSGAYDVSELSSLLRKMKDLVPDKQDATILVEPNIPYESLIEVMDAVRLWETELDGKRVQVELFPDISIGDAPASKQ
jgi:biopolymer transport protein ExbD